MAAVNRKECCKNEQTDENSDRLVPGFAAGIRVRRDSHLCRQTAGNGEDQADSRGEYDPAVWGKNYPLQYASYLKNRQMSPSPTGYGGSEKVQKSIMQPELLTNFKGNPFSKDYTEDRGHPYAVEDLLDTKRIGPTSPGACITCKTAHVETFFKDMGWGYAKVPLTELTAKTKLPKKLWTLFVHFKNNCIFGQILTKWQQLKT